MKPLDKYEQDELKNAPLLSAIDKKKGWDVPEGYFDNFPKVLLDRIDDEALLENSLLNKEEQVQEDFQVPEGYFANFPGRIMQQVEALDNQHEGGGTRPLWQKMNSPVWALSIAALIAFFFAIGWLLQDQANSLEAERITTEDLIALAEQGDIDAYALASELDLSFLDIESVSELSEDDLEEFLEDLDLEDLQLEDAYFEGI